MKYLVDFNVLSEPTKPAPDPRVIEWLRANEPEIAVDPVILGELRFGILILPWGRKRAALERWFDAGELAASSGLTGQSWRIPGYNHLAGKAPRTHSSESQEPRRFSCSLQGT